VTRRGPHARPILRDPAEQEVSPLELLFDLVFVLGVAQLTHHLVERPTWRGAAEVAVLYLPMFAVWMYTSWAATLYSLDHPRARRMVIVVMLVALFMNVSLTRAFDDAAWVFVATFLGIQLGRTTWMLTTGLDATNHEHFVRTLVWLASTAPVWIAGAAVSTDLRLPLRAQPRRSTWPAPRSPIRWLAVGSDPDESSSAASICWSAAGCSC
jgi:low temperature requirement protein LtrA